MLTNRIAGAFTFKREVFAEVENDPSFTSTAWLIVIVVGFLNQLGAYAGEGVGKWILGAILGTVGVVVGFAVGAFVISLVGRSVFNAQVSFDELVRTLGLAYVWNVIGFLGIFSGFLSCILAPVLFLGAILGLIAWFVAAKEALDLEWLQTIVTVVIGWIALLIVIAITGAIIGLLGLAAAGVGGLLSP